MEREILFRGKHIHALPKNKHLDGTWIYGYLEDQNYIFSPELEGEFLVDHETVCQYTGLTDKNGNKIFEGDIVNVAFKEARTEAKEKIYPYLVEFCQSSASFELFGNDELLGRPCFEVGNKFIMEVVGNVFDNLSDYPKLIGEQA